jgi:hypothetical protein
MHSINTTDGFIIDSKPYGEAGKILSIFTRDLGLVTTTAQGIRLEKSKLRYSAQLYSFGTFSFVRGKEFWRLTNAEETAPLGREQFSEKATAATEPTLHGADPPVGGGAERLGARGTNVSARSRSEVVGEGSETVPAGSGAANELRARLALLLCRLLHGEEAHPELFDCVARTVNFSSGNNLTDGQTQTLESLTVARMLHMLGYIGDDSRLNGHLRSSSITVGLLDDLKEKITLLNKHINKALRESHL